MKELLEELSVPHKDIGVHAMRINDVANGKQPINAELALHIMGSGLALSLSLIKFPMFVDHNGSSYQ